MATLAPQTSKATSLARLELTDERWRAFVDSCPDAGPFHHPAWASLLSECYGYRAFALALEGRDGIEAGLPVVEVRGRWVSLPFTDVCAPLAVDEDARSRLAAKLDATRRQSWISRLEVRAPLEGAYQRSDAVLHTLELGDDPEALFGTFNRSRVQRGIRKAEKGELVVRRGETEEDLADVFYGLHLRTRRRLGVPVQPRRFFQLLWRRMLDQGLGFVLLAYAGDVPVAGAVFLASGGTVVYKYGASDAEFWKLNPNHLIFWTAIRSACENGDRVLDFGRTDTEQSGLREFKSGWGTVEKPLVYSTLADRPPELSHGRLGGALGAVIRRSPPMVCRVLGETLYKYAA